MFKPFSPDISIVIPVFNAEAYIARCASSLFSQTKDNLEFIFIDDCSADDSISIIRETMSAFPSVDDHVKIVKNPRNMGPAATRQNGFQKASGKYIAMIDADDFIAEDMYAQMYDMACKGDYDIVMCDINVIEEDDDYRSGMKWDNDMPDNGMALVSMLLRRHQLPVDVLWNKIFKRELIVNELVETPRRFLSEDFYNLIQWYSLAKSVGYVDLPLYNYRVHSGSLSSDINALECRFGRLEHLKDAKRFLHCRSLYNSLFDDVLWCHKAEEIRIQSIGTDDFKRIWSLSFKPMVKMIWERQEFSLKVKLIETIKRVGHLISTISHRHG